MPREKTERGRGFNFSAWRFAPAAACARPTPGAPTWAFARVRLYNYTIHNQTPVCLQLRVLYKQLKHPMLAHGDGEKRLFGEVPGVVEAPPMG
jgi:hypothetical protein